MIFFKGNFLKKMLIIICLSLTDWANFSNDLLFFGLLLEHDAEKCLIRATISGQPKIAFSEVSSLTHRAPQNRCGNFQESCSLGICLFEQENQKEFSALLS